MLSEKQKKITQYLQNSFLFITFAPKKYRINLMSDEIDDIKDSEVNGEDTTQEHSDYKPVNRFDASAVHHLSGMYQNWFLDYASYVILERAVPHIEDGLKPV